MAEHSKWFKSIKNYYDKRLYNNDEMKTFVIAKYITDIEYKEITGIDYVV